MNRATRTIVATLGAIFGLGGMGHGYFEVLQGNTPTGGIYIAAIGEAQRMWPHGHEYAITLLPNFLLTGIAALLVGLGIIVWSIAFVQSRRGPIILVVLFVVLLLTGGGVAQLLFFPWIGLVATQINSPLTRWRKLLPTGIQRPLGKVWLAGLITSSTLLVFVLGVSITGFVPGVEEPDAVLSVMLACLGAEVVTLPITFVAGLAHDMALHPARART